MDVFWVGRTRDHNEAHLGVPTQNDLNVGLVILLRQLGKDWFIDQAAITEPSGYQAIKRVP